MLLQKEATVTICHVKTRNLAQHTILADILIVPGGVGSMTVTMLIANTLHSPKRLAGKEGTPGQSDQSDQSNQWGARLKPAAGPCLQAVPVSFEVHRSRKNHHIGAILR